MRAARALSWELCPLANTEGSRSPSPERSIVLDRGYADFYEKALFVKPTWRLYRGRAQRLCALRAMLLSALSMSLLLLGSSVHYEIRLDSD